MTNYYRLMLGRKSAYATECFAGGFVGADFGIAQDLSAQLPDEMRSFNATFIPVFLASHPGKTKISAGLACGALFTVAKAMQKGDVVLCPDGSGVYRVGEVIGDYAYAPGEPLPHRRAAKWLPVSVARSAMSEALQNSSGSIGTVSRISDHRVELEHLLSDVRTASVAVVSDSTVEDPVAFAMEKHLEDFLVRNWGRTELSERYNIFEEDGEPVGQQYPTDAGPIDILCISKDKSRLLVVELKRGRASDVVVGQLLRYMGYVMEQIAEPGQIVEGAIVALEDDQKLRWALVPVPSIAFYRYQVSFSLSKG